MASQRSNYLAQNRFGLGIRPGERSIDNPQRWLEGQLRGFDPNPRAISRLPGRRAIAEELIEFRMKSRALRQSKAMDDGQSQNQKTVKQARRSIRQNYIDAAGARFDLALNSRTPFAERLTHFWSNHFAISADKSRVFAFAGDYEFRAIRPNIMGKFGDLLSAAVLHPAMLFYLDQHTSLGPNSPTGTRARRRNPNRKAGLNENLAREILELHTLGVRSVYTQADVLAFAKALTGWTVVDRSGGPGRRRGEYANAEGETRFLMALHEPGSQQILGRSYGSDGAAQSKAVLADLAVHPATAKFIATKLARHFVADTPPASLVTKLEQTFLETGGDLSSLYRTLITAPESWQAQPAKFKTPWDWTVSTYRALGTTNLPENRRAVQLFDQLGQPIWRPGSPAGFADQAQDWASPDALMRRVKLADRLASQISDDQIPLELAQTALSDALAPATRQAIVTADSPGQAVALLLVSPEFMRR